MLRLLAVVFGSASVGALPRTVTSCRGSAIRTGWLGWPSRMDTESVSNEPSASQAGRG
jgi:hypothetical protein